MSEASRGTPVAVCAGDVGGSGDAARAAGREHPGSGRARRGRHRPVRLRLVAGERWLAEHFALGGRALYGEQATGFLDTRTRRSALAEAEILTGIASSAGRLVAGVGIGSGSVEERSSRFCLFTCAPPPPPVRSSPLVASLVGGVIGYREWLAVSAMARLQLIDGGWDLVGEVGIGVAF